MYECNIKNIHIGITIKFFAIFVTLLLNSVHPLKKYVLHPSCLSSVIIGYLATVANQICALLFNIPPKGCSTEHTYVVLVIPLLIGLNSESC